MKQLKTIDIKGKDYVQVNQRVKYFCETYKGGQIITELVSDEGDKCIFKATALIDGVVIATGHAYEKEGDGYINKTSYLENCETSAVGRCLGFAGIGIDPSIATYEEVQNAIMQQEKIKAKEKAEAKAQAEAAAEAKELVKEYVHKIDVNCAREEAGEVQTLLDEVNEAGIKRGVWNKVNPISIAFINSMNEELVA